VCVCVCACARVGRTPAGAEGEELLAAESASSLSYKYSISFVSIFLFERKADANASFEGNTVGTSFSGHALKVANQAAVHNYKPCHRIKQLEL